MKILSLTLSRKQLLTIYKTFARSHLNYADIIYDKPFNDAFKEKLEKVQYSAKLTITRALLGNVCTKNLVLIFFVIEGGIAN